MEEIYFSDTEGTASLKQRILIAGESTQRLLAKQKKMLPDDLIRLETESKKILMDCVSSECESGKGTANTVLAMGYVQSGKTLSFETLTTLARDNNYRLVIIIAGRTNILLDQTHKRLKDDLEIKAATRNFVLNKNLGEKDLLLLENALRNPKKPTIIITVLKHQKYLTELASLFSKQRLKSEFEKKGVIIIDDESDQASLNTFAQRNEKKGDSEPDEFSAIYEGIKRLRNSFPHHTYVQYTATPQANLLIDFFNLLSPDSIHVLSPGKGYTGGKTYFKLNKVDDSKGLLYEHRISYWNAKKGEKSPIPLFVREIPKGQEDGNGDFPNDERYHPTKNDLSAAPPSLKEALRQFLIGATITTKLEGVEDFVSMLVHPTHITNSHKKFKSWISASLEQWLKDYLRIIEDQVETNDFHKKLQASFLDFKKTSSIDFTFDDVWEALYEILTDIKLHLVHKDEVDMKNEEWEDHLCHILIGGNKLDRGFTVRNLICTYMPRYAVGKSNADTIQQRCRFFGYKEEYLKACRVFLPAATIDEYADYVEDEEMLREYFLKYNLTDFFDGKHAMHLTPRLNATRKNVISSPILSNQLSGYKFFNPFGNYEDNNQLVHDFIAGHKASNEKIKYGATVHDVYEVSIDEAFSELIRKFKFIYPEDDILVKHTALFLEIAAKYKKSKAFVLNMSQGSARERTIKRHQLKDEEGNLSEIFRISYLQGANKHYPGDRYLLTDKCKFKEAFKYQDDFIIQLHNIKPKDFFENSFYGLAIYYPESITSNYIALNP